MKAMNSPFENTQTFDVETKLIIWLRLCTGAEGNFRKSHSDNSMGTPYDYGSIMHYGARFFSKNSKPTIVPKKAGVG